MKLFKVAATKYVFADTSTEAIERVVDIESQIEYKADSPLDEANTIDLLNFVRKLKQNKSLSSEDLEFVVKTYLEAKGVIYEHDILDTVNTYLVEMEEG